MDITLDDGLQELLLLISMLDNWETLVVSVSNFTPNVTLTVDLVWSILLDERVKRKDLGQSSSSGALMNEKNERRGHNQSKDHHRYDKDDAFGGISKSRDKSQPRVIIVKSQGL